MLLFLAIAFSLGLGSGYLVRDYSLANQPAPAEASTLPDQDAAPISQVTLPESYTLPVSFGDIGPQLLAAGAIDADQFVQLYTEAGQPLTEKQLKILKDGDDGSVVIDQENAYFLLNFFWALGLTNQNALLTEGPMKQYSNGDIAGFASTGGWTLGTKPATELYASTPIITLTPEQQARLEEVAQAVHRPCCDNPTSFPDCNHGMAMLGLLQLMAAQGATTDEMLAAAKYVNAFWFPQQTLEMALLFKHAQNQEFDQIDPAYWLAPPFLPGPAFNGSISGSVKTIYWTKRLAVAAVVAFDLLGICSNCLAHSFKLQ
jgi:hypothetical protein